jgi:phosphatidylglycerophosphate synthase
MESIKELREKLQAEKVNPVGWKRPWGYILFQRGPSIYITRLLLPLPIKPNYVTIAGLFLGLAGCYLVFQFEWYLKLIGLGLLYLHLIADRVDGEIARYKNLYSLKGIFWDEVNHFLIPPLFWIGLTFGLTKISIFETRYLLVLGALGALALATIRIAHSLSRMVYAKKFIKMRSQLEPEEPESRSENTSFSTSMIGLLRTIFRPLANLQDFFVILVITTGILILEQWLLPDKNFHVYLTYMVIIYSYIYIAFAIEAILRNASNVENDIRSIDNIRF